MNVFVLAFVGCVSLSFAVKGVVLDEFAKPVEGVSVSNDVNALTVFTDSKGAFDIDVADKVVSIIENIASHNIELTDNRISLSGEPGAFAEVNIYNSIGVLAYTQQGYINNSGRQSWELSWQSQRSGLYYLRARIGLQSLVQTYINSEQRPPLKRSEVRRAVSAVPAESGSLVIAKTGYVTLTPKFSTKGQDLGTLEFVKIGSKPVASGVSIVGNVTEGSTLKGRYTFVDADNDKEGVSTYRWLRDGVAITGATDTAYAIQRIDSATVLSFEVVPVALTGTNKTGLAVKAVSSAVAGFRAPVASSVSIAGTTTEGSTLKGRYAFADADNDLEGVSTYRWLRDGVAIVGATDTAYAIQRVDSATVLSFEVTPVSLTGTNKIGLAVKAVSSIVTGFRAPVASSVSIVGTTTEGSTLKGRYSYTDADNDLEGASIYRWLRDGAAIAGATDTAYAIQRADSAKVLSFEVTPVALTGMPSTGLAVKVVSASAVTGFRVPVASSVSIAGTIAEDSTLKGRYSYADADNDLEGVSTYRWLRDSVAIIGATDTAYVITTLDIGKKLIFEVTPKAASSENDVGLSVVSPQITVNGKVIDGLTDARDNHEYDIVYIGAQVWMAENLAYLPQVDAVAAGSEDVALGKYYYVYGYTPTGATELDEVANAKATTNYTTYGVLYNWDAADNGGCPSGWHLPSLNDWLLLSNYIKNDKGVTDNDVGKLLKANSALWNTNTGTDVYGFAGLPTGYRERNSGSYLQLGDISYWWTTSRTISLAHSYAVSEGHGILSLSQNSRHHGVPVRCLMD